MEQLKKKLEEITIEKSKYCIGDDHQTIGVPGKLYVIPSTKRKLAEK